jgi:subtilisin-like proprotein convertase family protein
VVYGAGYTINATATDDGGATTTATVSVTVKNGGGTCIDSTFNSTDVPKAIPDNNKRGIKSNLPVTGNGTVASLALSLHITHTFIGDLKVTLISPAGTRFVVWNRKGGATHNLSIVNMPIAAFSGQAAAGNWRLAVQDLAALDVGTLDSWSLNIIGKCTMGSVAWTASATPEMSTVDNTGVCTTIDGASIAAGGDSSLAQLDLSGSHTWTSILRGTLTHNGVTVEAFPLGTFPDGANTFTFANRTVGGLSGDASGPWKLCIVDTDGYGDVGVLDSWSVHD